MLNSIMRCFHPIQVRRKLTRKELKSDMPKYSVMVPCGRCVACMQNKRNAWTFRLFQEMKSSESAWFVTLTYDDEHLPKDGVSKEHCQKFMKLLRYYAGKDYPNIRYYLASEYGTKSMRAHYHAIIFNLPNDWKETYDLCVKSWTENKTSKGFVSVLPASLATVAYTTGYMLSTVPVKELDTLGLARPFSLMSRQPGLGVGYASTAMIKWHGSGDNFRCYVQREDGVKQAIPRYYREKFFKGEKVDVDETILMGRYAEKFGTYDVFIEKEAQEIINFNKRNKKSKL